MEKKFSVEQIVSVPKQAEMDTVESMEPGGKRDYAAALSRVPEREPRWRSEPTTGHSPIWWCRF
jgi:hypothetical protein